MVQVFFFWFVVRGNLCSFCAAVFFYHFVCWCKTIQICHFVCFVKESFRFDGV